MIIVTGANGQLGRLVVERLLERVPAEQVGVSVRDPEKAQALAERGVRVRQGDFGDAASLAHAFEGATRVFIVSSNSAGEAAVSQHRTAINQHRTAINAAKAAGASRIVYTSQIGANPTSPFYPMVDHAATEVALRESGVPFTSLRNGYYATAASLFLGNALTTGEAVAPEDGLVAYVSHPDLAEAAAIALTGDQFDGVTPNLTGAEALDMAGVAALASELAGRPIRRVVVSDADYRAGLVARGVPEPAANMLLSVFQASRRGDFARTDPTLARLLGRPVTPLRDIMKAAISAAG